jgi:hypothetical protein
MVRSGGTCQSSASGVTSPISAAWRRASHGAPQRDPIRRVVQETVFGREVGWADVAKEYCSQSKEKVGLRKDQNRFRLRGTDGADVGWGGNPHPACVLFVFLTLGLLQETAMREVTR